MTEPVASPAQPREPSPYSVADFERLSPQLVGDVALAEELGRAIGNVAASTVSEFQRVAQALKFARQGGELSMAASLKRLEERVGREPAAMQSVSPEFRRVAEATKQAMRENGGEPVMPGGMSFWQRTAAVLSNAYERAVSWTKDVFTSFVERVRGSPNAPQRNHELER